ncbi:uncharacterized protein BDW43DRAFT_258342 [Aspergillus alliaceus]|uniref:uncharacterized protein n=1 Tax=Petromyces alliaceus TaxID=209559 RepID=UPI0012A48D7A|nr:uncharacterized protein BDW43DRAFT_258342 [Aspergillus alliaceus]KAB8239502.1 hypothetical protein BDW43DRAFT_258342 [Aspergillus alliaceus]
MILFPSFSKIIRGGEVDSTRKLNISFCIYNPRVTLSRRQQIRDNPRRCAKAPIDSRVVDIYFKFRATAIRTSSELLDLLFVAFFLPVCTSLLSPFRY